MPGWLFWHLELHVPVPLKFSLELYPLLPATPHSGQKPGNPPVLFFSLKLTFIVTTSSLVCVSNEMLTHPLCTPNNAPALGQLSLT